MENKRTRISALLLVLALILSVFGITAYAQEETATPAAVCYVPGDVNCDGNVDSRDAIYTLYASLGNEDYPVSQDCDFDGDGEVQFKDAIWLLYASLGMGNYQLEEAIHVYHDPIWTWNEDYSAAELTLFCNCGESSDPVSAEITVDSKAATCTESGTVTYTATAGDYTDAKTVHGDQPAGHEIGEPSCDTAAVCANCDFTIAATGHSYVKSEADSIAATCQAAAKDVMICSVCGDRKEVSVGNPVNHRFEVTDNHDLAIGQCQYAKQTVYSCSFGCGITKTERTEVYTLHRYTRTTTQEPTCVAAGETTYTCDGCGHSYTEEIPANSDLHAWTYGTTSAVCANCSAQKTIVTMSSEGLKAEEITSNEIVLENNASVTLDDATLENIDAEQTVQLEVNDVTDSFSNTTGMEVAAVYDLNMFVDGEQVSQFAGEVTVSLPYTLQPGDDVNAIDVYYIDDNGNVTSMQGTYAGGYVTFTTNHFSYYTICITPYCERFGHQESAIDVEPTCEEGGYRLVTCNICGYSFIHVEPGMEAMGHRYNEINVEGHCTEDIYYTLYCQECGIGQEFYVPATGHAMMVMVDESVAATCTAPGKIIYRCDHICNDPSDPYLNNPCEYSYEKEIPQLAHNYAATELEQTCTAGGGTQYTCTLCGDSYMENATAPAGHSYVIRDWSWNEYKTAVTVNIGCENCDFAHSQKAVISRKVIAPTCEEPGKMTITAKATYNMKPYEISVEVPMNAVGHQAGEEMLSNAGQHYYECIRCGKAINAADHVWGDVTVTLDPSCVNTGIGVQDCAVCGYHKEIAIPATGEHSYENGKCSVCGFEEGSCNHVRTYETVIDLAEQGGCEGTIYVNSCECGYQGYAHYNVSCNFADGGYETYTDENGFAYSVWTSECTVCGLHVEYMEYGTEYDPINCRGWNLESRKMTLGDTVLVDVQGHDRIAGQLGESIHPTRFTGETVDLRGYGMCSEILKVFTCPCGEHTEYYSEETSCNWRYDDEQSYDGTNVFTCTDCGAVKVINYTYSEDNETCIGTQHNTITYYVNGEEVYSYENTSRYAVHYYDLVKQEFYGDSCGDGNYIWQACRYCGKTREEYTIEHRLFNLEYTELDGMCATVAVQGTCNCSEQRQDFWLEGDGYCYFRSSYDYATSTWTYTCTTCGAVKTEATELIAEGENCQNLYRSTFNIYNPDGEHQATGYSTYWYNEHNMQREYVLHGTTCTDGVDVVIRCTNCDYRESYTIHEHQTFIIAQYNVSRFGLCGGNTVSLIKCPCGEKHGSPGLWDCDWNHIGGTESSNKFYCPDCESYMTESWVYGDPISDCMTPFTVTYTLEKEGVDTLRFTYDAIESSHTYIYELSCDGETCNDGFRYYGVCQGCGAVDEGSGRANPGIHRNFEIARDVLTKDLTEEQKLCGDIEMITYACPCGESYWEDTQWINGECQWDEDAGYYDEELDAWVDICKICGVEAYSYSTFVRDEGELCKGKRTEEIIFRRDGEILFTYAETWNSYNHEIDFDLELIGETCDEGYRVLGTCIFCGEYSKDGISYGCDINYATDIQIIENENICGGYITWKTLGCACTPDKNTWPDGECNLNWYWDEANDMGCDRCDNCGLMIYSTYGDPQPIEGEPCYSYVLSQKTFVLNGETIGVMDIWVREEDHTTIYGFRLLGEDCSDGYYVTELCQNCDYYWENHQLYFGHNEKWPVEYYDLADYGACGGFVRFESCACGAASWWDWEDCNYLDEVYCPLYCNDCGTTINVEYIWAEETHPCYNPGTFTFTLTKDDETRLDVGGDFIVDWHSWETTSVILDNPGGSCEDGVTTTETCSDCGESYSMQRYYHYDYRIDTIDLKEKLGSTCGGEIRFYACACGEENDTYDYSNCSWMWDDNWSETIDGVPHSYTRYVCQYCNMVKLRDWAEYYTEGVCDYEVVETITFTLGDNSVSYQECWTADGHTWIESVELMPGSVTCADGIYVHRTCDVCGAYERGENYWCQTVLVDSVDFGELGFCEGYGEFYSCACGERTSGNAARSCTTNDNDGIEVYLPGVNGEDRLFWLYDPCTKCGLQWAYGVYTETVGCKEITYWMDHYIHEGEIVFTEWDTMVDTNHDYEYTYTMYGDSCTDGVEYRGVCSKCNAITENYTEGHNPQLITEDLYLPEGICDGYYSLLKCPCGLVEYAFDMTSCSNEITDESSATVDGILHQYETRVCTKCGLIREADFYQNPLPNCQVQDIRHTTLTFNGEVVGQFSTSYLNEQHNYERTYELQGDDCAEDGVRITEYCTGCGYSDSWTEWYHVSKIVETLEIPEQFCGGGTIERWTCLCGADNSFNNPFNCSFSLVSGRYETDDNGIEHYYAEHVCDNCGLRYIQDDYEIQIDGCQYQRIFDYTYFDGEEVLGTISQRYFITHHNTERTYELQGDSCEDGVLISEYCTNCDYSDSWYNYGHFYAVMESCDLPEGSCGGRVYINGCPCGEYGYIYDDYACDFDYWEDGGDGWYAYSCYNCGTIERYDWQDEYLGNCLYNSIRTYTYSRKEQEDVSISSSSKNISHKYDYTYTLMDGAETCEDGVWVSYSCDCGINADRYDIYYHEQDEETIYLPEDSCGGYIKNYFCACGYSTNWYRSGGNCWFNVAETWTGVNADGIECSYTESVCSKCGLSFTLEEYTELLEGCMAIDHYNYTFYMRSENVGGFQYVCKRENHNMETEYVMLGESCEDGVEKYLTCRDCGQSNHISTVWGHDFQFRNSHMPAGACFGYYEYSACVCGLVTNASCYNDCDFQYVEDYYETRENGTVWYCAKNVCNDCGLVCIRAQRTESLGNCEHMEYVTVSYYYNGEHVGDYMNNGRKLSHDARYTSVLLPGSASCEDGIELIYRCDCGEIYKSEVQYGHPSIYTSSGSNLVESIDLSEYGVCGGYNINVFECPCGLLGYVEMPTVCNWETIETAEGSDEWMFGYKVKCTDCGLIFGYYVANEYAGCYCDEMVTLTFAMGDVDLGTYVKRYSRAYSHENAEYQYDMNGTTCEEGYTAYMYCSDCGYSNTWESTDHISERYYLYDGICGGWGYIDSPCAVCGTGDPHENLSCNFQYIDGEDYEEIREDGNTWYCLNYACSDCGLRYVWAYYSEAIGNCNYLQHTAFTYYFNNEEVAQYQYAIPYQMHNVGHSSELLPGSSSCEDGVLIIYSCACGEESWTDVTTSHPSLYNPGGNLLNTLDLSQYTACGGTIKSYACPCGVCSYIQTNIPCSWDYVQTGCDDPSVMMYWKAICSDCGLTWEHTITNEWNMRCYCDEMVEDKYTLNGVVIGDYLQRYSRAYVHENADYEYVLNGTTCEEGYTAYVNCPDCGYSDAWKSTDHVRERFYLYDGICGGWGNIQSTCEVCGHGDPHENLSCNFQYVDGEDFYDYRNTISYYCENYVCSDCGLRYVRASGADYAGNCQQMQHSIYTYYFNGNEVGEFRVDEYAYTEHKYHYSSELLEGSVTCRDGVLVSYRCDCGEISSSEVQYYCPSLYSTGANLVDTIYLAEYGTCGGQIEAYECPCGICSYIQTNIPCSWEYVATGSDDPSVMMYWKAICSDCGLTWEHTITNEWNNRCYCDEMAEDKYTLNGVVIGDFIQRYSRAYVHENAEYQYDMNGTTCEEGYTAYIYCSDCGYTDSWDSTEHVRERFYLYDGICGGWGNIQSPCEVCGYSNPHENLNCNFQYIDGEDYYEIREDGNTWYCLNYACSDCGLRYVWAYHTEAIGNCNYLQHTTFTYYLNNEEVAQFQYAIPYQFHSIDYSFYLMGDSCEDGVEVTEFCNNCDYSDVYEYYDHQLQTTYTYLPQGSCGGYVEHGDCGGYVEHGICVCGEEYSINDFTSCNIQFTETTYAKDQNNLVHQYDHYACTNCGFSYVCDITENHLDECDYMKYITVIYYYDGIQLNQFQYSELVTDHKIEIEFEMNGNSCNDGVVYTDYCSCGEFENIWEVGQHEVYQYETCYMPYGSCGGYVGMWHCACQQSCTPDFSHLQCNFVKDGRGHAEYDDGMEIYSCQKWICTDCGLSYEHEIYNEIYDWEQMLMASTTEWTFYFEGEVFGCTSERTPHY